MKVLMFMLFSSLFWVAEAQNIDDLGGNARPTSTQRASINWGAPFELVLGENGWGNGGPYSREVLLGLVAELVNQEWGGQIGSSTIELLNEAAQREALWNNRWVADSPRLKEKTLQPAEYMLEIATGGSNSGSRGASLSLGGVRVELESGSAEAIIVLSLKDLVTGRRVKTFVGRAKYGSTNLEELSIDRLFAGFKIDRLHLSNWDNSPGYRRGLVATALALEKLRQEMRKFKQNSGG
jgi:hypothetical protein